jgi:anti-anti-sigma factor
MQRLAHQDVVYVEDPKWPGHDIYRGQEAVAECWSRYDQLIGRSGNRLGRRCPWTERSGILPRAMLNFDLETETKGSSALVRIRGDLDIQVVERVTDALTRLESDEPELLVIDLSQLSFMDSTGMAAIAAASIRAREAGRRFAIVMPPAGVRRAIEITGLEEVITTTDDLTSIYP